MKDYWINRIEVIEKVIVELGSIDGLKELITYLEEHKKEFGYECGHIAIIRFYRDAYKDDKNNETYKFLDQLTRDLAYSS